RMELYAWNSPVGIAAGSGRLLCFINDVQVFSSNLTTFITTPCFITCGGAGQSGGGVALVGAWTAMWNRGVGPAGAIPRAHARRRIAAQACRYPPERNGPPVETAHPRRATAHRCRSAP